MKIIILVICLALFSCNSEDKEMKRVNAFIDSVNKVRYLDSIKIEQETQLEIAKYRLEKATGKKDTMTDAEHLKQAEENFKQR